LTNWEIYGTLFSKKQTKEVITVPADWGWFQLKHYLLPHDLAVRARSKDHAARIAGSYAHRKFRRGFYISAGNPTEIIRLRAICKGEQEKPKVLPFTKWERDERRRLSRPEPWYVEDERF